jgi:hypothetical protein
LTSSLPEPILASIAKRLLMSSGKSSPLTFDLQHDLLEKLKKLQRRTGARSLSEVIRYAVSHLKLSELDLSAQGHQQVSVRLSDKSRQHLVRLSKQKKVSLGELLRAALDSLPSELPDFNPEPTMPKKKATTKKAAPEKVVRKAPASKKAVKKKVAKKPVKKVAVKKPAKKKAVKKAVKKTVAKKAAKKKVAKKAAKKKVAPKPAKKKAVKKAVKKKAAKKTVAKKPAKKAVKKKVAKKPAKKATEKAAPKKPAKKKVAKKAKK